MISWPEWDEDIARGHIGPHAKVRGGLLPALHALQDTFGCIDQKAIDLAAEVFNFSRAEVYGVARFYDDFRKMPPALPILKVCMGEACQAVGAAKLKDYAREQGTGKVEIEDIFCLGNCACGPAVVTDTAVHGRMSPDRIDALVRKLEGGEL